MEGGAFGAQDTACTWDSPWRSGEQTGGDTGRAGLLALAALGGDGKVPCSHRACGSHVVMFSVSELSDGKKWTCC